MIDGLEVLYVAPLLEPGELEGCLNSGAPSNTVPEDVEVLDDDEVMEVPEIEAGIVVTEL